MTFKDLINEGKNQFVKETILSDEFMEILKKNVEPMDTLMAHYRCAIMEVETKFKVLNEQFSLEYDRNPIEGIKSRIKSVESLAKKVRDKNIPMTIQSIEENNSGTAINVNVVDEWQQEYPVLNFISGRLVYNKWADFEYECSDVITIPPHAAYLNSHKNISELSYPLGKESNPLSEINSLNFLSTSFNNFLSIPKIL